MANIYFAFVLKL